MWRFHTQVWRETGIATLPASGFCCLVCVLTPGLGAHLSVRVCSCLRVLMHRLVCLSDQLFALPSVLPV